MFTRLAVPVVGSSARLVPPGVVVGAVSALLLVAGGPIEQFVRNEDLLVLLVVEASQRAVGAFGFAKPEERREKG